MRRPLTFGSAVTVKGLLSPSPAKGQVVELVAEDIDIVQTNDPAEYPFKFKERHHVDYYRQYLHLRPRDEQFASLLRVRNSATMAIHEYFQENDFVLVHTPILTSNDCEGGGETFSLGEDVGSTDPKVKKAFFNKPVVLTVSGQLHLEAAVSGLSRVYNFNPAFRAERQQSRRHLSGTNCSVSFLVFRWCSLGAAYFFKMITEHGPVTAFQFTAFFSPFSKISFQNLFCSR